MDERSSIPKQYRLYFLQYFILALFVLTGGACTAVSDLEETDTSTPTTISTESSSQTPIPTATFQATETPRPVTKICSPLFDHELSRISEYISDPFAPPLGGNLEFRHHGTDFSYFRKDGDGPPIEGTPIQSVLSGRVAGLGFDRLPYGNMLIIETPHELLPFGVIALYELEEGMSLYLLYAHMLENPEFAIGEDISCGQIIGQVGSSGNFVNAHLHLETRVGISGQSLASMAFYETTATLEEQDTYRAWRTSERFALYDPMLLLSYVEPP